jgi:hypothetical protein
VAEAVGGHSELERHRRPAPGPVARRLEEPASVGEHVGDDGRVDDAGQEVGAQHPLVVLDDLLPGLAEQRAPGDPFELQIRHDAVVEPDERQMCLGDHEVLVVAEIGNERQGPVRVHLAAADPGEVEPVQLDRDPGVAGRELRNRRPAHLEPHTVLGVELPVVAVGRAPPVDRVQVQCGRTALDQLVQVDILAELRLGPVHRQVVVDELPQVGEPGRHRRIRGVRLRGARVGDRRGQRGSRRLVDPHALRPEPGKPEPPKLFVGLRLPRGRLAALVELENPLADDEERIDAMPFHMSP